MANGIINKNYDDVIADLKQKVDYLTGSFATHITWIYGAETTARRLKVWTQGANTSIMWSSKNNGVVDVLLNGSASAIISGTGASLVTINSYSGQVYDITIQGFEWYSYGLFITSGNFVS